MKKFIEVAGYVTGKRILVNPMNIVKVREQKGDIDEFSTIETIDEAAIDVKVKFNVLEEMIEEALGGVTA